MNSRKILKHAFIDTFCNFPECGEHLFSKSFEDKMFKLIKLQKSAIRAFNTTAKRVAVIIIIALFVTTSTLFSVKAVRDPVIDAIKSFIVNARQMLSGTVAEDISSMFPDEVSKIVATSYVSETLNKYNITDSEKIQSFIRLISETHWEKTEQTDNFHNTNPYWSFDFYEKDTKKLTIKMCDMESFSSSLVAITRNGETNYFHIDSRISDKLLAFTNKTYYLHNSNLKKPADDICKRAKTKAETGLKEGEIIAVASSVRNAHYLSEGFLIHAIRYLKESNSIYWDYCISGEEFSDPVTNRKNSFNHNKLITDELEFLTATVKDAEAKQKLTEALTLWRKGMKNHEPEYLFKAHEILHDYDNYVYNFPTKAMYVPYGDYQGINDYFGHIS